MVWGGRREEGSGWGTHVYLWQIHFDIWQNEYNFVKFKNKIKLKQQQQQQTRPGADSGSDHELIIAKFSLKLKKVGPTTRPFRYDPDQITYNFTVEVTNRFKELDLVDRVPEELWMKVCNIVQ